MTSLIQTKPAEVAHAPGMSAAESFSQSSTRVEKPSAAPPAAQGATQTTVAAPAATAPVATEMKPPPPRAANGSTAAGYGSRPTARRPCRWAAARASRQTGRTRTPLNDCRSSPRDTKIHTPRAGTMPFRHRQRVRSGTTAAEASAFGAARREARVVGEGAAGDEKDSVHI